MREVDGWDSCENEIKGELRGIADGDGGKNKSPRSGEGDCGVE